MKTKLILLILAALFCVNGFAISLPASHDVPGGVVIEPVGVVTSTKPEVFLGKHKIMVISYKNQWVAVVGVPLVTKPGQLDLSVQRGDVTKHVSVLVHNASYPKSYIIIKKKRLVNPRKTDMSRIYKELARMNAAIDTWSVKQPQTLHFIWPVKGRISTPFGLHRYYNGQPRSQHSGIDIAVPMGTAIKAVAPGKVVLTGRFFFTGNTIVIDHGEGLMSIYCHLSKIKTKEGKVVAQGDVIGLVGSTGRSTGPHLHLSIKLNTTSVNPMLFFGKK